MQTAARPAGRPSRLARDWAGVRGLVVAVPVGVWVALLVGVSTLTQVQFVRGLPVPRIFGDELIYSELARSFAATGEFAVREVPSAGYGVVYPALIAPAFALFSDLPQAYAAAKVINAVLISLAAVPAYLLARLVLGRGWAFVAAALAVAVPSMVYSGSLMTENAFYPLFLLCALVIVRALERPSAGRQVAVLLCIALAFLTRAQAVVLVPGYLSAVVLMAAVELRVERQRLRLRPLLESLRAYRLTWLLLAGGGVLLLAGQALRGRSPLDLLGAYQVVVGHTSVTEIPRWFAYHLADLDLYTGVLPFAAACIMLPLALGRHEQNPRLRALAAATLALTLWMTLLVAAFSTSVWSLGRLHERNVFYVVPLLVIWALVWVDHGRPRPARLTAGVVAGVVLLPLLLPFSQLKEGATVDALALLPWSNSLLSSSKVPFAMGAVAFLLALLFLKLPARLRFLVPAIAFASFYVTGVAARWQAHLDTHKIAEVRVHRGWIDDAVGPSARVTAVWVPSTAACAPRRSWGPRWLALWQNEFFNRSVRRTAFVVRPAPDGLRAARLRLVRESGTLLTAAGLALQAPYVVLDESIGLRGARVIARDAQTRTVLYRLRGPVRLAPLASGCATGLNVDA
jgi:hypothetical protein